MSAVDAATKAAVKWEDESLTWGFDFTPLLPSGVTLSSASTVTVERAELDSDGTSTVTTGLTIGSDEAVNAATFELNGATVAIGKGVQVTISAGTAGVNYHVRSNATDSNGDVHTVQGVIKVRE